MELQELQNFIKELAGLETSEIKIETKDLKLTIRHTPKNTETDQTNSPIPYYVPQIPLNQPLQNPSYPAPPNESNETAKNADTDEKKEDDTDKYITVKSPMVGTFYRKPSPEKPPYVNIGDEITPGKVICIIEAMKLFNEIEAETGGRVVKILTEDATPVEFDQPLFLVEPLTI